MSALFKHSSLVLASALAATEANAIQNLSTAEIAMFEEEFAKMPVVAQSDTINPFDDIIIEDIDDEEEEEDEPVEIA